MITLTPEEIGEALAEAATDDGWVAARPPARSAAAPASGGPAPSPPCTPPARTPPSPGSPTRTAATCKSPGQANPLSGSPPATTMTQTARETNGPSLKGMRDEHGDEDRVDAVLMTGRPARRGTR